MAKAGQLVNQCQQVIGVGINCIAPTLVGDALDELHRNTKKALVVYPNQGASYNPEIKEWEEIPAKVNFSILTKTWYEKGARLIGGCCTTGPKEIEQISTTLKKLKEGR